MSSLTVITLPVNFCAIPCSRSQDLPIPRILVKTEIQWSLWNDFHQLEIDNNLRHYVIKITFHKILFIWSQVSLPTNLFFTNKQEIRQFFLKKINIPSPPSCQAHCAESGAMSSIPFTACWSFPGCICVIKNCDCLMLSYGLLLRGKSNVLVTVKWNKWDYSV